MHLYKESSIGELRHRGVEEITLNQFFKNTGNFGQTG